MTPDVTLRPAGSTDRAYAESLLEAAALPTADLETALAHLFVCETADGDDRVGVGGLEPHGEYALFRSVAESRRRGAAATGRRSPSGCSSAPGTTASVQCTC
ncbi:MAG: hypothetical protein ACOCZD_02720 [Haloferacaceae archaeon]